MEWPPLTCKTFHWNSSVLLFVFIFSWHCVSTSKCIATKGQVYNFMWWHVSTLCLSHSVFVFLLLVFFHFCLHFFTLFQPSPESLASEVTITYNLKVKPKPSSTQLHFNPLLGLSDTDLPPIIIIIMIVSVSRAPFHVKYAQMRWTGANTKIQNTCI